MIKRIVYRKSDGDIIEFHDTDANLKGLNNGLKFVECECGGNETNISQISAEKKDISIYDGKTLAPLEFLDRFTPEETAAVETSANIYAIAVKTQLLASTEINLDDAKTINGLNKLVEIGLLTEARKNEILE